PYTTLFRSRIDVQFETGDTVQFTFQTIYHIPYVRAMHTDMLCRTCRTRCVGCAVSSIEALKEIDLRRPLASARAKLAPYRPESRPSSFTTRRLYLSTINTPSMLPIRKVIPL